MESLLGGNKPTIGGAKLPLSPDQYSKGVVDSYRPFRTLIRAQQELRPTQEYASRCFRNKSAILIATYALAAFKYAC